MMVIEVVKYAMLAVSILALISIVGFWGTLWLLSRSS